ncbi:MAG: hydroxymethylbilane synthase [Acidobacteriaceae bacterium]|nr:hydroxymethylbilane synthase [Acidobacteriaceae bacterium]
MTAALPAITSLTIGSRGSQLALWQANYVAQRLSERGLFSRIQIIKTLGDSLHTASLTEAGGKGLFTKEIEEALLAGSIDIAVHSLKDLPTETPNGLRIAAIPVREDPRDAILGSPLNDLPRGARIGTSSGRRAAQMRLLRPDLDIQPIRGNVDTRIRKLREGQYDAIVLAVAGLRRLGFDQEIAEIFSPEQICPAPGQGALAIQTRENDPARQICAQLNDHPSSQAVACERAALAALGGGCQLPLGVFAQPQGDSLHVIAIVVSPDGSHQLHARATGALDQAEELGKSIASDLLARGAGKILAAEK